MGGGSGSTSSVQESPLPDYAQDKVEKYLQTSNLLSNEAYAAYTGSTYAERNSDEADGITAIATRARAGHTIVSEAESFLGDTLDGNNFNTNPKAEDMFAALKDEAIEEFQISTLPGIHRAALLSGNWGSSGHHVWQAKAANDLTKKIADISERVFGGDYNDEREYQFAAAGHAITYGMETAKDMDILRQAGLYDREYVQAGYDDSFKRWKEVEVSKVKRLEILGNAIRAMVGAQVVTTAPLYRPSEWSQIASVALAGVSAYAAMYSGPKRSLTSSDSTLSLNAQGLPGQSTAYPLSSKWNVPPLLSQGGGGN